MASSGFDHVHVSHEEFYLKLVYHYTPHLLSILDFMNCIET